MREDLLVPYAFTGPNFRSGVAYGLSVGRHTAEVALGFGAAPTWTRDADQGLVVQHEFGGAYFYRWLDRPARAQWVGGSILYLHELDYPEAWDSAHGYWLDALLLGPAIRHAEQVWDRAAIELRAELGLVGLASRPPSRRLNKQDALNKGHYHLDRLGRDPQVTWVGETAVFQVEGIVRLRCDSKSYGSGFGAGAQTRFSRATWPEPYTSWYAGLLFSYGWSFP